MDHCKCSKSSYSKKYASPEEEIKALKKDKSWYSTFQVVFYGVSVFWLGKGTFLAYQAYEAMNNSSPDGSNGKGGPLVIGASFVASLAFAGWGYMSGKQAKKATNKISGLEKKVSSEKV